MNTRPLFCIFSIALGTSLNQSYSAATRIAYIDPFATARGNAFAATADNPSAVFYNAAGLTQVEDTQIQGQVFVISLGYEFDGDITGRSDMDDKFQPVPSFFASHKLENTPFTLGFGAYAPFALGTDWGGDAAFALLDPLVPYEADLQYIKYHAVVAWEISKTLSLAAGFSYDDSAVDFKANALEYDGTDEMVGYSLSLLWQPSKKHSFGLNYQAKTEATYRGDVSGPVISQITESAFNSLDGKADFVFPESIIFGYSYRPNDQWNFEFNLDWTNWDRVDALEIETVLPVPLAYELNWESAFIWELGATRYLDNGWHLSGGYTFVENAVPDADFLPIVPDSDRHFFAVGIGQTLDRLSWMLAYQQAFDDGRSVSDNEHSPTLNGDYDLDSQAVTFSLNLRF